MLELVDLRKQFDGVLALDGCTFSVERGHVLGFLGRNGAGKTTAMRSIFGLVQPDGGSVRWLGDAVQRETRTRFGYMPEERGLYPRMKVGDQLQYFGRLRGLGTTESRRQADHWLQRLDLADRASSSVDSLSHGNQQKVQLGVSLMGPPDLLVLDEPFSGLDPIAADTLSSVIKGEAERGAAVVFSSHQLDLVGDVCDDIAIITHGKTVLTGNLERIRRDSPTRSLNIALESQSDPHWAARLKAAVPGTEVIVVSGSHGAFTVRADVQPAEILAALGNGTRVNEFRLEPPSLDDIFRQAVGESL
jgi:ABC-2 type transport system ATP-binding protein